MRSALAIALLLPIGCRTKAEEVVCASDDDCTVEEYFCDTALERCVRRMCEQSSDCPEAYGYTCDVTSQHCVRDLDGGPDGSTSCDRDGDGVDGPQCKGDDCDDNNRDRAPGKDEICNDGIDDDCDEATSEGVDADDDDYCAAGGPAACCAETAADCCDSDSEAHPGVTAWFYMADGETACGGWDYDCSGTAERERPNAHGCMCDVMDDLCNGTGGWLAIPLCGQSGTLGTCSGADCSTNTCPDGMTSNVQQGCH